MFHSIEMLYFTINHLYPSANYIFFSCTNYFTKPIVLIPSTFLPAIANFSVVGS